MANETDITTLNSLIKTTFDSVKGFQDAAEDTDAGRFASLFGQMANDRDRVARELQDVVRRLGGTPADGGSVAGSAHRAFMNFKELLSSSDEKAVINEVERGEDYIKSKFEEAIADANLSVETRGIVERCYGSIREGHDRVSALKHSMA